MTLYQDHAYKHGVGWSIWHLEWVTKYRHNVFSDAELQKLCGFAFEQAAKRHSLRLDEYEVQPDHVHLLVHLRPSMDPAKAVMLLKGYSSRLLFLLAENKLRKYYWAPKGKRSLWGDGKFVASVGHITLEKAKEYLERQKAHHANSTNSTKRTSQRNQGHESPPFRVGVIQLSPIINCINHLIL
jgi:putative transposase